MQRLRMDRQKVVTIGNSLGVTIDPQFLQKAGLSKGAEVVVRYADEAGYFTIVPAEQFDEKTTHQPLAAEKEAELEAKVDPEFRKWVEKSLDEDAESLKELANL